MQLDQWLDAVAVMQLFDVTKDGEEIDAVPHLPVQLPTDVSVSDIRVSS